MKIMICEHLFANTLKWKRFSIIPSTFPLSLGGKKVYVFQESDVPFGSLGSNRPNPKFRKERGIGRPISESHPKSLLLLLSPSSYTLEPTRAMPGLPRHLIACLGHGRLALLGIMVAGGIVLQVLACALYNNWWPMLTVVMYVILPMPLLFFAGPSSSSIMSGDGDGWVDFTKFLTGASVVGSVAIPSILKHAGVIGWGALAMELSSFFIFALAILLFLQMNNEDEYGMF